MFKKFLISSPLILGMFFSQVGFASILVKGINPPEPVTLTCPDIPTTFTIGGEIGGFSGWFTKSDDLPRGAQITLDQYTTIEYLNITAVPWFTVNAVQCNYKLTDSESSKEYSLNIYNWAFVKDCKIDGPKSMTCLPA